MLASTKDFWDLFDQNKSANTPKNLEEGKITANINRQGCRHKLSPGLQDINLETGIFGQLDIM